MEKVCMGALLIFLLFPQILYELWETETVPSAVLNAGA